MLLVEEEAVLPIEDSWARGPADEIAEGIPYDCCEREGRGQLIYIQVSPRGEQPGSNQEGITG
jgi:hypothetical protein